MAVSTDRDRHEPHRSDDCGARDGLRAREFTARELTEAHLAAIEALNPRLNAFVTVTGERALAQADAADAALARGEFAPLTGIPLAIKDLFCTEGVRTTAGSRILGRSCRPMKAPSAPICCATARCSSARRTWTNSPWARRT